MTPSIRKKPFKWAQILTSAGCLALCLTRDTGDEGKRKAGPRKAAASCCFVAHILNCRGLLNALYSSEREALVPSAGI